jgi:ribosomal protein L10
LTQAEHAAEEISRVQLQLQQKAEEVHELKQQLASSQSLAHVRFPRLNNYALHFTLLKLFAV